MSKKICKELKSIMTSLNLILSALEYNVSDTDLVAQELAERLEKAFTPMDIDERKRKGAVSCSKLPDIHIENRGAVTIVYVSSDKLVELGILTYDQLNDLLEKKQL